MTYVSKNMAVDQRVNLKILIVIEYLMASIIRNVFFDFCVQITYTRILIENRINKN